jgi:NAD(P)-dependent dehydrogenase (short-subunit alcohol dehydrogenase family)
MAATKWTVQQIPSQTGKTALVTGANSGIGYQAALELARHGAHVFLACRNAAKGQAALERLKREAPGNGCSRHGPIRTCTSTQIRLPEKVLP